MVFLRRLLSSSHLSPALLLLSKSLALQSKMLDGSIEQVKSCIHHVSPVQANKYSSDKVTKNFAKCKQAHVGMEPQKPTKQDGNTTTILLHHYNTFTLLQYFYTISTSCAIFAKCLFVLVVCRRGLNCAWETVEWV